LAFHSVYLTTQKWTLGDIGLVLTIGAWWPDRTMPGGAVVDARSHQPTRRRRRAGGIGVSALMLALWPIFIVVSRQSAPCRVELRAGPRVRRHQSRSRSQPRSRTAWTQLSFGLHRQCVLSAAVMGAVGYLLSSAAVFYVTRRWRFPPERRSCRSALKRIDPVKAHGAAPDKAPATLRVGLRLSSTIVPFLFLRAARAVPFLNATMPRSWRA